jgi:hypothetical protein
MALLFLEEQVYHAGWGVCDLGELEKAGWERVGKVGQVYELDYGVLDGAPAVYRVVVLCSSCP